jgi:hypothetical protein
MQNNIIVTKNKKLKTTVNTLLVTDIPLFNNPQKRQLGPPKKKKKKRKKNPQLYNLQ